MIREANENDYGRIDEMQFGLQKYFSEIDQSSESLPYRNINGAHRYMQKMMDDVKNMNGKVFVAEEKGDVLVLDYWFYQIMLTLWIFIKRVGLYPMI